MVLCELLNKRIVFNFGGWNWFDEAEFALIIKEKCADLLAFLVCNIKDYTSLFIWERRKEAVGWVTTSKRALVGELAVKLAAVYHFSQFFAVFSAASAKDKLTGHTQMNHHSNRIPEFDE